MSRRLFFQRGAGETKKQQNKSKFKKRARNFFDLLFLRGEQKEKFYDELGLAPYRNYGRQPEQLKKENLEKSKKKQQ